MSAEHAYHVRWATKKDLPEMFRIHLGSEDVPFTEESMAAALREKNVHCMIAENPDGRIVGFMVYEIHVHCVILKDFIVASDCRRRGIGTVLLAKLTLKLGNVRNRIYIDVPETRLDLQLFLRACEGFYAVGVERGRNGDRDVFQFMYKFTEPARSETGAFA